MSARSPLLLFARTWLVAAVLVVGPGSALSGLAGAYENPTLTSQAATPVSGDQDDDSAGPVVLPIRPQAPAEEAADNRPREKAKPRFKRRLGTGPSLRDELVDMVREDPDAAASILRGWIGNAG